ncbi:MAG: hypothetical protein AB1758_14570 [Candidatus Eremiobacterota bacterium]
MKEIRYVIHRPGADRVHRATPEDVQVVLNRLPGELWERLKAVHFNDRSQGARVFGYANRSRREIALCALPPRVSLARALHRGQSPATFGAQRGAQWPVVAVRRFLLYDVLLRELGHLQEVEPDRRSEHRRFAGDTLAQAFADTWRRELWSTPFDHPDPAHHPPG